MRFPLPEQPYKESATLTDEQRRAIFKAARALLGEQCDSVTLLRGRKGQICVIENRQINRVGL